MANLVFLIDPKFNIPPNEKIINFDIRAVYLIL